MACNADHDFGPTLPLTDGQCRIFDFTLLFEHLFFNLVPSVIVTVLAVAKAWGCIGRRKIIAWPLHKARKSAVLLLLSTLQVVQIAILSRDSRDGARFYSILAIPASSLTFVAILSLVALTWLEHSRSPGPSLLIQIYIFLTLVLDAVCLRSSWLITTSSAKSSSALVGAQGAAIILKILSLVLESLNKPASRYSKPESYGLYSSEQRAGVFGRTFLSWLYPIFSSGYRRPLTPDDLCLLETCLSGTELRKNLETSWYATVSKSRWRLVVALAATFYQDLLLIHLPRLGLVASMITQPLLVQATLSYITNHTNKPLYFGYSLIVAYALTYLGVAIMTLWSQHLTFRLLTKLLRFSSQSIGKKIPTCQARWMQSIQTRVKATTIALKRMEAIKMLGLSPVISIRVQEARQAEMEAQKSFRRLQVLTIAIVLTAPLTLSAFAVAQTVSNHTAFDVVVAFSSLSLLSILIMPIAELVTVPTNLLSTLSCLDRIQAFLLEANYQDSRVAMVNQPQIPVSQCGHLQGGEGIHQVVVGSSGNCPEAVIPLRIEPIDNKARAGIILVDIHNGSFSWKSKDSFMRNINIQIFLSDVVMITGPVGAGKSMLLNSLLGETTLIDGSLACLSTKEIAYCAQEPWIPNSRLREVVLGSSPYHPGRYAEVVQLCELREEIDHMVDKDETLALARAVYSQQRLLLLDDPFSALDTKVAYAIFHSLLGKSGFLRREGRTVVLTTQNCDQNDHPTLKGPLVNAMSIAKAITHTAAQSQGSNELIAATKPHKQSSLAFYVRSMGRLRLLIFIALTVILVGLNAGQTLWLKFWVNQYNLEPNPNLGHWAGIYVLLGVLTVLSIAAETGYGNIVHSANTQSKLAPMSFFANHSTGTVLNLFTSDLNLMDLPLALSFLMTCEKIAATLAELALTSIASGYLAAAIPVIAVIVYFVQRIYGRTSRQLRVLDLEAKAPLFSHFVESFDGRVTIRSFAWTDAAERQNMEYLDASQRPHYLLFCLQRWLAFVLDLIAAGLATLLVAIAVALRHTIDPNSLAVGLVSVIGFGQILNQLVTNWSNLDTSLGAVSRIKKYVTETPVEEHSGYCGLEIPASWPTRGQIVLRNVSCSYGITRVLKDINLRFEAGTKTTICGRTGSGKSSLLSILVRLIELDSGSVEIDDLTISQVNLDRLRKAIIAVPQDALFIDGSVRFNLNPYEDSDLEDDVLLSILRDTGLEKLIADHGGLEAEMHSEWFSTGQAQLFCLARAMLRVKGKNAGVLLLDEATSHLDADTAGRMNTILDSTFQGWTVLMVTHDPKSILKHKFGRVVILHEGTIAEDGEPMALLALHSSHFSRLWRANAD
ncbi:hypothetical protein CHU98_g4189 [Xylaria longipes]|nr:hypothetical protein CHU98_g4189 [Xylaria longipes]